MIIKLRCWHIDLKKMEYPDKELSEDVDYWDGVQGSCLSMINHTLTHTDKKFMLFTGQKDMNGRELYQGDIISHWCNQEWSLLIIDPNDYDLWPFAEWILPDRCEWVGNIYENPELLNA